MFLLCIIIHASSTRHANIVPVYVVYSTAGNYACSLNHGTLNVRSRYSIFSFAVVFFTHKNFKNLLTLFFKKKFTTYLVEIILKKNNWRHPFLSPYWGSLILKKYTVNFDGSIGCLVRSLRRIVGEKNYDYILMAHIGFVYVFVLNV